MMLVLPPLILTDSASCNVVVMTMLSLSSSVVCATLSIMSPIIDIKKLDYDSSKFSGSYLLECRTDEEPRQPITHVYISC